MTSSGNQASLTGAGEGSVTVTASAGGKSGNATVTVVNPPRIQLGQNTFNFAAVQNGPLPSLQTLAISNAGGGNLGTLSGAFTYGATASNWMTSSFAGTAAPTTVQLRPGTTALPVGTHTATFAVTAPNAANAPQTASVTFQVAANPAVLAVDETPVALFSNPSVSRLAANVAITNSGTGSLGGLALGTITYQQGEPTGWVAANLNSATAPATVAITANIAGLSGGTYHATIPIQGYAANAPLNLPVTLQVTPANPLIGTTPGSLTYNTPQGFALPPDTVTITNVGTGTLTGLCVCDIEYGPGAADWLTWGVPGPGTAPAIFWVSVDAGQLPPGTYTANLRIFGQANNSPQLFPVTVTVTPGAAQIVPTVPILHALAIAGGTSRQLPSIPITSSAGPISGLRPQFWSFNPGDNWLGFTLGGTTTPVNLSMVLDPSQLSAGPHTFRLALAADNAGGALFTLNVDVTAIPPGLVVFERGDTPFTTELWRMSPNGALSSQLQLTNNAAFDGEPALSPDRTMIAFRSDRSGTDEIWTMAADGSNPVQQTTTPGEPDGTPAWVGNSFLIYSSQTGPGVRILRTKQIGAATCNPSSPCPTGTVSLGFTQMQPSASPTSPVVAFASNHGTGGGNYEIWTWNYQNNVFTNLSNSATDDARDPVFSPDGTKILFTRVVLGNRQMAIMNADGTGVTAGATGEFATPAWAPDGTRIIVSIGLSQNELLILQPDGLTNFINLTNSAGIKEGRLSWR
ncbi:MAG: TolB family protein [Gemmatimonadales bacterium]